MLLRGRTETRREKLNMWSAFMGSPIPCHCHLLIPKQDTPSFKVRVPSVFATAGAQPQRRRREPLPNDEVGDLGLTLLSPLQSNPGGAADPVPNPRQQKQELRKQEGEGAQITGSDVLWALQRATALKKKKKKQQRRGASTSGANRRDESDLDYSNVRPLCIKTEWAAKLDELEKRLRGLSQTL